MNNKLKVMADKIENGKIIKSCQFILNGKEAMYYFAFDEKYKEEVGNSKVDPWLILLIHKMLAAGGDWFLDGKVSKSLLDNVERYCTFWYALKPEYKTVHLIAKEEIDDPPKILPDKAIMTFSGGVDACFTIYRHRKHLVGRNNRNIEQAIFIQGADIDSKEDFALAAKKAEKQCSDLDVNLILTETNFRSLPHNWELEHLNVIVSVLNFFENYPYKVISSSMDYAPEHYLQEMPYSTNIVTDRYLSSNMAPLFVDDEAVTRTQKTALIKNWRVGLENLRVCWQGEDKSSNCGQCEKCMRTMFNFLAAGAGKVCAFNDYSYQNMDKNIRNIYVHNLYDWREIFAYAEKRSTLTQKQMDMLKFVVDGGCAKKKHHSFWWHLRRMKF